VKAQRQPFQRQAAQALVEVLHRRRSLSFVLRSEVLASVHERDRSAFQDCCYGVLRWLGPLRGALSLLVRRPPEPEVEALLLVALYQLEYTRVPEYAAVDSAVRACGVNSPGAKAFVNGVLRNFLRDRADLMAQARGTRTGRYSYPEWWIDRIERAYPDAYSAILDAGNQHPPMTLRVNRRATCTAAYVAQLAAADIEAEVIGPAAVKLKHPRPVDSLPGFAQGMVSVQDFGAQLAAPWLELHDGQRVLDACAAPGGKTAHLLESADVRLTALDSDQQRLEGLEQNLRRLGLKASVRAVDAADTAAWWDGVPFQRILLDAPCTASGVVRRHPDIKWLRRESDIAALAREQSRLLRALWHTLERGGKLLYVTCSLFPEENRAPIADFLAQHADAARLSLPGSLAPEGQLLPSDSNDGFFYALLQKR
jgi:16S rRNA (cytosine967-C5)-methyltransferase